MNEIPKEEIKIKQKTNQVNKMKFVTKDSAILLKTDGTIQKYISIFYNDDALKSLFHTNFFWTVYKGNKNLKELIAPSSYPRQIKTGGSDISNWNNWDICKNYINRDNILACRVNGLSYFMRGQLNCD